MIYLIALWMYGTPIETAHLVDSYDTMEECIYSARLTGFDPNYASYGLTVLDDDKDDNFILLCQSGFVEVKTWK